MGGNGGVDCHRSGLDGDGCHFGMPHGGDGYRSWINHDDIDREDED